MKILELYLKAFGPFHELRLDFSGGNSGLHLVYGGNEAGKTSALEGLTGALFGFRMRCPYNFRHKHSDYRVGLTVRPSSGDMQGGEVTFLRRKAQKDTLRAADDSTVIAEARLELLLKGLNRDRFRTRFGFSHADVVQGSSEIAAGKGDLSEVLFTTAGGLSHLRAALEKLDADAGKLYSPRAKAKATINLLLTEIAQQRKDREAAMLLPSAWRDSVEQLNQAHAAYDELQKQIDALEADRRRLERLDKAALPVTQWEAAQQQLAQLAHVPLLSDDFTPRRREADEGAKLAAADIDRWRREVEQLDQQQALLSPDDALLARRDEIESLTGELGAYKKALAERPQQQALEQRFQSEALDWLAKAGRKIDLDTLPAALAEHHVGLLATIGDLAGQQAVLEQRKRSASDDLRRLIRQIEQRSDELAKLPSSVDVGPLASALNEARRHGNLAADVRAAKERCSELAQRVDENLARLPGWQGTVDELRRLALPTEADLQAEHSDWQKAAEALARLDSQRDQLGADIRNIESQQQELTIAADLPEVDALKSARAARDEVWQQVVDQCHNDRVPAETLLHQYAALLADADALADRRFEKAEQFARQMELTRQRAQRENEAERLEQQIDEYRRQHNERQHAWQAVWRQLGLDISSPAALLDWSRVRHQLLEQADDLREAEAQRRTCDEDLQQQQDKLTARLVECGIEPAEDLSWHGLLELAEQTIERSRDIEVRRNNLREQLGELEQQREAKRDEQSDAEKAHDAWRAAWISATRGLTDCEEPLPADVNARLECYAQAEKAWAMANEKRTRCEEMTAFLEPLDARAHDLAAALRAPLAERPTTEIIAALQAALAGALQQARDLEQLKTRRQQAAESLQQAERDRQKHWAVLETLCGEAKVDAADKLPEVEQQAAERRRAQVELNSVLPRVQELAAGGSVEQLRDEVRGEQIDALPARIGELEQQIAELRQRAEKHSNEVALRQKEQEVWQQGDEFAAQWNDKLQASAAQLGEQADAYARLSIAAVALKRASEQYRQRHQGPILDLATRMFRDLTDGSFERLQVDEDEKGNTQLLSVRADGSRLQVGELSEGTRDQLYLALRLASLQEHVRQHGPFPLVLDDILVMFDDRRAIAALKLLGELSRQTQIIFFTHHQHLCELAQKYVPAELLFTQSLQYTA